MTTDTDWPHSFDATRDQQFNWICSDGIKWHSYETALKHQENLEHNILKKLQVEDLKDLCSKYTESHGIDMPNHDMKLCVAFTTVLTLAALYAKELYLEHGPEPNVNDDNFMIALRMVTDFACIMYDKPTTSNLEKKEE